MLAAIDKSIIGLVSQDIPLVERPFEKLAETLGVKEGLLLKRLKVYRKEGLMRKFSATLNHRKVGFRHNAMVVWNIPDDSILKAAKVMASFHQVSHSYERKRGADWNYSLYSMIHCRTKKDCIRVVRDISKRCACKDFRVLFSTCEHKKSAVKY